MAGLLPARFAGSANTLKGSLRNPISLHDLASMAGLSDCHFARAFKQSVGMPPHRYLMKRRVERAAMLIQRTDRPLSEIALEVGCSDQSHFSRLVVRATGQTPRALRRGKSRASVDKWRCPALWPETGRITVPGDPGA